MQGVKNRSQPRLTRKELAQERNQKKDQVENENQEEEAIDLTNVFAAKVRQETASEMCSKAFKYGTGLVVATGFVVNLLKFTTPVEGSLIAAAFSLAACSAAEHLGFVASSSESFLIGTVAGAATTILLPIYSDAMPFYRVLTGGACVGTVMSMARDSLSSSIYGRD
jgi:hypothetical protein